MRACVCVCVCPFSKRVSGGSKIGENASNAAIELWLSAKSPGWRLLAALLSQFSHNHPVNSGHFFAMRRGHVVYNCALYLLLYQQCRGFYCCSKRVVNARSVF